MSTTAEDGNGEDFVKLEQHCRVVDGKPGGGCPLPCSDIESSYCSFQDEPSITELFENAEDIMLRELEEPDTCNNTTLGSLCSKVGHPSVYK